MTLAFGLAGFCALVVVGCMVYVGIVATRDDYELMNDWQHDRELW